MKYKAGEKLKQGDLCIIRGNKLFKLKRESDFDEESEKFIKDESKLKNEKPMNPPKSPYSDPDKKVEEFREDEIRRMKRMLKSEKEEIAEHLIDGIMINIQTRKALDAHFEEARIRLIKEINKLDVYNIVYEFNPNFPGIIKQTQGIDKKAVLYFINKILV